MTKLGGRGAFLTLWLGTFMASSPGASALPLPMSHIQAHAFRLGPGDDLYDGIVAEARRLDCRAGFIVTTVGSVRALRLRFADQPAPTSVEGKFEIVSLVGTVTRDGAHLHMSASNGSGVTLGGHLVSGNPVYTTAEIVLGELTDRAFIRELDPRTTYRELTVQPRF
jgi:hypothetical protein